MRPVALGVSLLLLGVMSAAVATSLPTRPVEEAVARVSLDLDVRGAVDRLRSAIRFKTALPRVSGSTLN